MATTIPQRELRNNAGAVLRRAEAGEVFTVTVSGRPVAQLVPLPRPPDPATFDSVMEALRTLSHDPTWAAELHAERDAERTAAVDPWS